MKALFIFTILVLLFTGCKPHSGPGLMPERKVLAVLPLENSEGFYVVSRTETNHGDQTFLSLYDATGIKQTDSSVLGSYSNGEIRRANDSLLVIGGAENDSTIFSYNFFTKEKRELVKGYFLLAVSNNGRSVLIHQSHMAYGTFSFELGSGGIGKLNSIPQGSFPAKPLGPSNFIAFLHERGEDFQPEYFAVLGTNAQIVDSLFPNTKYMINPHNFFPGRNPNELFFIAIDHRPEDGSPVSALESCDCSTKQMTPVIRDLNVSDVAEPVNGSFLVFRGITDKELHNYSAEREIAKEKWVNEKPGRYGSQYSDPQEDYQGRMMIRNFTTGETRSLNSGILTAYFSRSGKTVATVEGDYSDQRIILQPVSVLWEKAQSMSK